jgi:hypothetical protein
MNNEPIQNDDDDILKEIEYQYSSNSHDSLLQSDHPNFNTTTTSSIDDLPGINQLLSSTFYSKDSALGSSDDNLNNTQSTELIIQEEKIIFQDKSKFNIRHAHFFFFFFSTYHIDQRLNILLYRGLI